MSTRQPSAVVVGAGISGIACATELTRAGVDVQVVDRGRVIGGRMASRRLRDTGTRWDGRVVDYGASYFTARDPDFVDVVDDLITRGIVRPWTDAFHVADEGGVLGLRVGPMRYAAPNGLRSVVEHLAHAGGITVDSGRTIASVTADSRRRSGSAESRMRVDDIPCSAVAICMPGPQASRLVAPDLLPAIVQATVWEPVIAVTMVYPERSWGDLDGIFVNDSPVVRWIADDGRRRGDDAPVLVAHVDPILAAHHLDDPEAVTAPAIAATQRLLGLPDLPTWAWAHRWSLARPLAAVEASYASAPDAPLVFAGDAFADGPRVEAAWLSGRAAGRWLSETLAR